MRILMIAVMAAALAWSAYWMLAARRAEEATAAWFAERARAGWTASHGEIRTAGFPNRLDTTIYRPRLAYPHRGLGWDAPFVQIFRLSYKPEHAIVIFPESKSLTGLANGVSIDSERMRASVVLDGGADMPLLRSNLVADAVSVTADQGIAAHIETLLLAIRIVGEEGHSYDIGAELRGLQLAPAPPAQAGPAGTAVTLRLDATLDFDTALRLAATVPDRPWLRHVRLRELEIALGPVRLRAEGALSIDVAGAFIGSIDVSTSDWQSLLQLALEFGLVSQGRAEALATALETLSRQAGDDDRVPLRFGGGRISLGGTDVGPSPRLPLR